ncbi:MAG: hypothetical protein LBI28_03840 [Treponema sp.]|jgi:hypothetical protein|nr:hypothetical protein [Treponema sp.]
MENTPLTRLDLRKPIIYTQAAILPSPIPKNGEFLLCYELNPAQSRNIEPETGQFLGSLAFIGSKTDESAPEQAIDPAKKCENEVSLPVGVYLFTQSRSSSALEQEKWLDLAIEQQKDGLWERNKLGNLLYVRYLYEDSGFVTQLFRPLVEN